MKRLLLFLLCWMPLLGQNPNPQPTYAQTMSLRNPCPWVRFNGSSKTSFADSGCGNTFTSGNMLATGATSVTSDGGGAYVVVNTSNALAAGPITAIQIQHLGAGSVTLSQSLTFCIASGTAPNFTIVDSWTVTMLPGVKTQTYYQGTSWSGTHTATAGEFACIWASGSPGTNNVSGNGPGSAYYLNAPSTLPSGSNTYTFTTNAQFMNVFQSTGTGITTQEPGFDLYQKNNYSVSFPYNAAIFGPNGTLGDYEWSTPHNIYVHINNLKVDRLGGQSITLANKGNVNLGTAANTAGWLLDLEPDTADGYPLAYRVCYRESGNTNGSQGVFQSVCTGTGANVAADGVGLDILLADAGDGWINDDILYVNGVYGGGASSGAVYVSNFNLGFNYLQINVSGGTGYPASTPVSIVGGGPNCVVNEAMLSSGGVPTGSFTVTRNSGCTTTPSSCGLAASSGSGATLTCTLTSSTLSTSSTDSLVIGGTGGISPDTSQSNILVDEFAIFPTHFSPFDATNIYYHTNWFQNLLGAPPATPPKVIFIDDGSSDADNQYALTTAIGAHLAGYIKLIGLVNIDPTGSCGSLWRQMLDQAGLNQIPVGAVYTYSSGGTGCNPSGQLAVYNASTPTASTTANAVTVLRTLMAANPTTAVQIFDGSNQLTALAQFMQSPADGISSLTGLQLMSQNATNGGQVYLQGGNYCTPTSPPAASPCSASYTGTTAGFDWASLQYVLANNGTTHINWINGTPLQTGDGIPYSRTSKDPMYLYGTTEGIRYGWDTLAFLTILTNQFTNGLTFSFSGGTGYAAYTPIDQTGGGTNCPSQVGWLYSSGGVPAYVLLEGGENAATANAGIYTGAAQGCTSLPTLSLPGATGTGVTVTPALTTICGTITVTIGSPNTTIALSSASCANHYLINMAAVSTASGEAPWFNWFANAFMDPTPVGQPRQPN